MSEAIHHECGIAVIRLRKPLEYYLSKYGTAFYGLHKLHLLMEKQHNRGQDGAGIACIKLDMPPGSKYINRLRSNSPASINDIFKGLYDNIQQLTEKFPNQIHDIQWLKQNMDFTGELFLGHLRYGTFGKNRIENLHPVKRANNWMTRNLVLAGNFNLTNVDELFNKLIELGQHPVETTDTLTMLEKIGHFLDVENEKLYQKYKSEGFEKKAISALIAENIDLVHVLRESAERWDGGYVMAGLLGHGDTFVMRDPSGIRPAYFYQDDEIVVVTSERPAIQTAFNVPVEAIKEVTPGNALIIKRNGIVFEESFTAPMPRKACSFERIYFSRGTDADIYRERKSLGRQLLHPILQAVDYDIENTVFSYIPNTAAVAFYGLVEALRDFCTSIQKDKILQLQGDISPEKLDAIFSLKIKVEKIAVKDVKLRTFITQDKQRNDLVAHVYDITYGVLRSGIDNLVVIDDSIVRGTTLKKSILRILDRLQPKSIVIASSAPQIRYPDCYGIDMAKLTDFVAFNAAIVLLKETHQEHIINEIYQKSKRQENLPKEQIVNYVKEIYKPFTTEQLSQKIAELVTANNVKAKVKIVYQTIENLHLACPKHTGDWYFTGNYPTAGGNKVVNKAFINFIEGKNERAY
ncbi:MAG: class II glutamine amidotransferase [Lentimicrobiaceae bacterium]|nr:class II glutamine amidotransferase [Lentimicrobiaceae bacterium]